MAKEPAIAALLINDAGQGHFALWLAHYLNAAGSENFRQKKFRWVLTGRNILALASAQYNLKAAFADAAVIPSADIFLDRERLAPDEKGYGFIAFFPEIISKTDRHEANWLGLKELLLPGGIVIAGIGSGEAERFDKKKLSGFTRMGDIKRKGFRALAYKAKF